MTLRNYETVFVMTPVLSEQQIKDTVVKYENFLKKNESEIVYVSSQETKKLSYPIQKKTTGIYQVIEFKSLPSSIKLLESEYKLDQNIIRYLVVSLDKHAEEYNSKKRTGSLESAKEKIKDSDSQIKNSENKKDNARNKDSDGLKSEIIK